MTWQLHPARKHFPAFAAAAIDGALILRPLGLLGRWSLSCLRKPRPVR